jgi:hypothetical protein
VTFTEIRLAIEKLLAGWVEHPVAFDGTLPPDELKAAQEGLQPWVRLTIQHGDSFTAGLSDKPCVRRTGLVMVQIFTADDQGSREAYQIADSLATLLQYHRDGDLETLAASMQRVGPRDGWYQLNIQCPFRAG